MIPKKIHYCWFGGNPLPERLVEFIKSWEKHCPDYEIIEWNESNYDINKIAYTKEAYEEKKYAFVSDYARLDIIYQEGGFYFDTDVEVLKSLEPLRQHACFMGCETVSDVATGLGFGAEAGHPFLKENMSVYEETSYRNLHKTCVEITTDLLVKHGLKDKNKSQEISGVCVYPPEFFNPLSCITGRLNVTPNSYSIHRTTGSWGGKNLIPDPYKIVLRMCIDRTFGKGTYRKILRKLKLKK